MLIPIPIPATSIAYKNLLLKETFSSVRKNNPNTNKKETGIQCLPVTDIKIWNKLVDRKKADIKPIDSPCPPEADPPSAEKIFFAVLYSNQTDNAPSTAFKKRAIIKNWDKSLVA